MDSYIKTEYQQRQQQEEIQQPNSGLLRFRSAPSSLFANFMDTLDKDSAAFYNDSNSNNKGYNCVNQDSDNFLSRFVSNGDGGGGEDSSSSGITFDGLESKRMTATDGIRVSHQLPPQYPKQQLQQREQLGRSSSGSISVGMDQPIKMVNGSNLARQSSSPAGFFAQLNSQNGYAIMNGTGMPRANGTNGDSSLGTSRLKGDNKSSIGHLPGIPEIGDENIKDTDNDGVNLRNGCDQDDPRFLAPGFSFTSWISDSSRLSEDIPEFLGDQHDMDKASYPATSDASHAQAPRILSHHLSLPKTSGEMAAMDKLLHFQDAVPCKIRAKRGCATHPRSIAERARRTRISERIKKLQELIPDMDKQMNTADMLDMAVDYIKDLQRQHRSLDELRSSCRCLNS